jgi:hypothetical protein
MTYYRNALAAIAVAIFYSSIPNYINNITEDSRTAPVVWMAVFFVLALPVLAERVLKTDLLKSPLIVWCFGYAWITGVWVLLSSQSDMTWQVVRWRALAIAQLCMFFIIFSDSQAIRSARQALIVGVLAGVAVNVYELFVPMAFSRVLGRSAGLYQNPNITGEALVMGMICSVTVLPSRVRAFYILVTGVGVFLTFSRAAILVWLIAIVGLTLGGGVRLKDIVLYTFLAIFLAVVAVIPWSNQLLTVLDDAEIFNKNVEERLAWLADPTSVSDYSSWERAYIAKKALDSIAEHPLIGMGTGSSREETLGVHNQYLSLIQDHGLLGSAIIPLLIMVIIWKAGKTEKSHVMTFGIAVLVLSLFTHNILDMSHSLVLFSLVAAMTALSRNGEIKVSRIGVTREVQISKAWAGHN